MSIQATYELSITFQAPLLSQANGTLTFGVDTAMQRYRGEPVLSGSLIRGNLRHAIRNFAELLDDQQLKTQLACWFGKISGDDLEPHRAAVSFDFFWKLTENAVTRIGRRTRIKMDDNEKVESGALQVIEDCFPLGTKPTFSGQLRATFKDASDQAAFEQWINKAMAIIPAMGSLKGIGFGRIDDFVLSAPQTSPKQPLQLSAAIQSFGIRLILDRPFCIGKPRTNDSNRIVSSDYIPGHVLKAVVAESLSSAEKTAIDFDNIAFSHALPATVESDPVKRPQAIPLSLATYVTGQKKGQKKIRIIDVAHMNDPSNTTQWKQPDPEQGYYSPTFRSDWKDTDWKEIKKEEAFNAPTPQRLALVRTQIEEGHSNVAQESGLFSLECCDTQTDQPVIKDLAWYASVDVSQTQNPSTAQTKLLEIFETGLSRIGKTKAHASVTVSDTPYDYPHAELPDVGDIAVITLMTDARILPLNIEQQLASTGSQSAMRLCYEQYWGGDAFELKDYYAQQQRVGGQFYYQRFQKHRKDLEDYCPEWLTVAGSVFVLKVKDAKGQALLEQWQKNGLPAYDDFDPALPHWQQSPHLPEHGFGQILVNKQEFKEVQS